VDKNEEDHDQDLWELSDPTQKILEEDVDESASDYDVDDYEELASFEAKLREFKAKFPDEQACRDYLEKWRWPEGFECPKCGHKEYYFHKNRGLFQCKGCRRQTSMTTGTIFHGTRTALWTWFMLIYLIGYKGRESPACLHRTFARGKNYKSILKMSWRIQEAIREPDGYHKLVGLIDKETTDAESAKHPISFMEEKAINKVVREFIDKKPKKRVSFPRDPFFKDEDDSREVLNRFLDDIIDKKGGEPKGKVRIDPNLLNSYRRADKKKVKELIERLKPRGKF
jgi:hypothetical protein